MNIYVVYNELDNKYQSIFEAETDLKARIVFERVCGKSPDYPYISLCRIGAYDQTTGVISESSAPVRLDKYVKPSAVPIDDINEAMEKK